MNVREKCRETGKNPLSQHLAFVSVSCASWSTLLTRELRGDASLWPKIVGKSGKWKKVKEKCWKCGKREKREGKGEKGEKRENWRKNGKNGGQRRKGENMREGKVGKPRGPQACYTISQTSLEFCLSCPVHHVRTASEKYKNDGKSRKNANLSRAHTGSSSQTDRNGTFTGPEGHTCSPLSQNQQTSHKKHGKKYNLMSKIDQKRFLFFRKVSGSKN